MKRKTSTALAYPKQAVKPKFVRQNASLINPPQGRNIPEKKNVDVSGSTGNIGVNTFSEVDLINGVAQNTGPSGRIGRKLKLKSLMLRWVTSTNLNANPIRILIVYDKSPNGILPSVTDILTNGGFNANMNLANGDRFLIIADEIHVNFYAGNNTEQYVGKIFRKLNLESMYISGAGGAIADITTGAVYVMSCGLGAANSGIGYECRIRYTDN